MGKALRQEHLDFFTARMDDHDRVVDWLPIVDEHEYLFRIQCNLRGTESDVIVHLTDAYIYGLAEFYACPSQLRAGSYVVIGMPHASATDEVIETAKESGIGIGHVGKFMGALNYKNIWEYMSPDERSTQEARQRRSEIEA